MCICRRKEIMLSKWKCDSVRISLRQSGQESYSMCSSVTRTETECGAQRVGYYKSYKESV